MSRGAGYTVTVPKDWSLVCHQACNGPITSNHPFTAQVRVVPRDGGLRVFHVREQCEP